MQYRVIHSRLCQQRKLQNYLHHLALKEHGVRIRRRVTLLARVMRQTARLPESGRSDGAGGSLGSADGQALIDAAQAVLGADANRIVAIRAPSQAALVQPAA